MKVSTTPTGFIMTKAFTSSDWDTVEFAIIRIPTEHLLIFQQIMNQTSYLAKVDGFNSAAFNRGDFSFHVSDAISEETYAPLTDEDGWQFIDTTEEEIKLLRTTECKQAYHEIVIDRDLDIQFKCYSKHSDDSFWTSEYDITKWLSPTAKPQG